MCRLSSESSVLTDLFFSGMLIRNMKHHTVYGVFGFAHNLKDIRPDGQIRKLHVFPFHFRVYYVTINNL